MHTDELAALLAKFHSSSTSIKFAFIILRPICENGSNKVLAGLFHFKPYMRTVIFIYRFL